MRALIVAALDQEVAHLPAGLDVAVTGVGKARAAAGLARRLADARSGGGLPDVVVNVGTAGGVDRLVTGLVEVTWVTQHDFPYDAMELLVGRPIDRGFALTADTPPQAMPAPPPGSTALATGDLFVADSAHGGRLAAQGIHLVDMEAFAYAAACAEFGVGFRCVKVVSDAADEDAGGSWLDTIDACARSLGAWVARTVG